MAQEERLQLSLIKGKERGWCSREDKEESLLAIVMSGCSASWGDGRALSRSRGVAGGGSLWVGV